MIVITNSFLLFCTLILSFSLIFTMRYDATIKDMNTFRYYTNPQQRVWKNLADGFAIYRHPNGD